MWGKNRGIIIVFGRGDCCEYFCFFDCLCFFAYYFVIKCYFFTMNAVRIALTDDFKQVLDSLQREYPLLKYPELIKMCVGNQYKVFLQERQERKIQQWSAGLPYLELSDSEQDSLSRALESAERGHGVQMTADEFMDSLDLK